MKSIFVIPFLAFSLSVSAAPIPTVNVNVAVGCFRTIFQLNEAIKHGRTFVAVTDNNDGDQVNYEVDGPYTVSSPIFDGHRSFCVTVTKIPR